MDTEIIIKMIKPNQTHRPRIEAEETLCKEQNFRLISKSDRLVDVL